MKKHHYRKGNSFNKDVLDFTKSNVTLGVGTAVVAGTGGSTASMNTLSGFMPIMGTMLGAKHVLKQTKKLKY